jgi:hypothetical protein
MLSRLHESHLDGNTRGGSNRARGLKTGPPKSAAVFLKAQAAAMIGLKTAI